MRNTRLPRRLGATAALLVALLPASAGADEPTTTAGDLAVEVVDTVTDLAYRTCTFTFTPRPLTIAQTTSPTGSLSTWYEESGGLTFRTSSGCRSGVRAVACLKDESTPLHKTYGESRFTGCRTETSTTRTVTAVKRLNVPYLGPDANGARPYGKVTLQMFGYRIGSNGKYPSIPTACQQYTYVVNPPANVMYPVEAGSCYDAGYVVEDIVAPANSEPTN
jgi:hypothetical protein